MVHYQRNYQFRNSAEVVVDDDEGSHNLAFVCGNSGYGKRTRPKLLYFLYLSVISCALILAIQFLTSPSTFSRLYSFGVEDEEGPSAGMDISASLCSSVPNGTICCDRSSFRYDICIMRGDVRTHSTSSSIFIYSSKGTTGIIDRVPVFENGEEDDGEELQHEKIKPYTRKWETSIMDTIDELNLILKKQNSGIHRPCDVIHNVPAVFFSTGGYTGNVYHEFNDGIIPLYITSQHLNKKVVFVILEYHNWWITKYGNILLHLSEYSPIDFSGDKRTHCFPEAIVGLKIHDELTVDPSLMKGNKTIRDFRDILDRAYWPRVRGLIQDEEHEAQFKREEISLSPSSQNPIKLVKEKEELKKSRPKLVILSRNGSRAIANEVSVVKMAEEIGFLVEVLRPDRTTELAKIYRALNSSDVMVGVHGAAMTHFLFMKPGCVFIQVIPLGTEWAADTYYGEPAGKLGLKYIGYKILPKESSLYDDYDKDDPVLRHPNSVTKRGWEFTKKIYLDRQTVRLNLRRFRKRLLRAYYYSVAKKNGHLHLQSQ